MDCEKFDRVVLDLLYEELDELTAAAAKRHTEHCSRCRSINSRLRATREVGVLPLFDAPEGLEVRILEAERAAHARLPLRQRLGRGVSILAGYAMRPQLAMAALLLLMIGSSLLLLRARPGDRENVQVTERGVPELEGEGIAIIPIPEKAVESDSLSGAQAHGAQLGELKKRRKASAETRASDSEDNAAPTAADKNAEKGDGGDQVYDRAMQAFRDRRYGDAQRDFDSVASRGGGNAAPAALFAAQAVRNDTGCSRAAPRFEAVNARYRGTGVGNEAAWQAADCYRTLGRIEDARRNYKLLLDAPGYGDRAQLALASISQEQSRVASKAAKAKVAPPAKPAAKAAPKQAKPAAKPKTEPKSKSF